jgi:small subunit ribosomal protein S20
LANHQSAIKRNRQNKKRQIRNAGYRTRVKNTTKNVLKAVQENDQENASKYLAEATRTISRVAGKGVLQKRAASRKISGLARKVHLMSASG